MRIANLRFYMPPKFSKKNQNRNFKNHRSKFIREKHHFAKKFWGVSNPKAGKA